MAEMAAEIVEFSECQVCLLQPMSLWKQLVCNILNACIQTHPYTPVFDLHGSGCTRDGLFG